MGPMPVGADIAGFGYNPQQMNTYLQSPQFQANTTMGGFLGNPGASFQTPMTTGSFAPGMGAAGAGGFGSGMFSMDGMKLLTGGIATIGNLWNAFQAQKLAKESFKFQKDFANTNLANQIQSYNTTLADRTAARGKFLGQSQNEMDAYVAENSLEKKRV